MLARPLEGNLRWAPQNATFGAETGCCKRLHPFGRLSVLPAGDIIVRLRSETSGPAALGRDAEGSNDKMARKENPKTQKSNLDPQVSLVPLYSPLDVTRGIQAYRRGDVILYTIRGEPSEVLELIGELDKRGVGELVALVSHRAPEAKSNEPRSEPDSHADKRH